MKLDEKSKEIIYILLTFLIVGGTLIAMFYPEYIKLPYSVVSINEIVDEVDEIENNLTRNEEEIETLIKRRNNYIEKMKTSNAEVKEAKLNFEEKTLEYHLPSMLITLEQGASNLQIGDQQFFIEYDKIDEGESINTVSESNGDEEKEKKEEPGEASEGKTDDEVHQNTESIQTAPRIEGISVMTIPLRVVNVSYSQARAYVEFLENLDFVEPSFVDLQAEEDKISLIVLVNVFHAGKEMKR